MMAKTSDYTKNSSKSGATLDSVEQQMNQLIASRIGEESSFPTWMQPNVMGWVEKNGALLSKATYAALWQTVGNSAVSGSEYDSIVAGSPIGACSRYADVDADTFRVPTNGQGGFSKAAGTNGFDIGTEDGGFGSQVEEHSHNTVIRGEIAIALSLWNNFDNAPWGTQPMSGIVSEPHRYENIDVKEAGSVSGSGLLTSPNTYNNSGETTPQGVYNRVWIYTGNIVSNLPEPTPDWLAQQAVNTQAIADINNRRGLTEIFSGTVNIGTSGTTSQSINNFDVIMVEINLAGWYDTRQMEPSRLLSSINWLGLYQDAGNATHIEMSITFASPTGFTVSGTKSGSSASSYVAKIYGIRY